jgi:hypothetical protein
MKAGNAPPRPVLSWPEFLISTFMEDTGNLAGPRFAVKDRIEASHKRQILATDGAD